MQPRPMCNVARIRRRSRSHQLFLQPRLALLSILCCIFVAGVSQVSGNVPASSNTDTSSSRRRCPKDCKQWLNKRLAVGRSRCIAILFFRPRAAAWKFGKVCTRVGKHVYRTFELVFMFKLLKIIIWVTIPHSPAFSVFLGSRCSVHKGN